MPFALLFSTATPTSFIRFHSNPVRNWGRMHLQRRAPCLACPSHQFMNATIALNFIRSAIAPMINAGVMMANIIWYIENTFWETQKE